MLPSPPYHETINKLLHAILQYFTGNPENMMIPVPPYYNITNDLLYAILNALNSGGAPLVFEQFRVLYVSARYGDDSTAQPNNQKLPYKTITAAKNNSFYNDIIHVMEGIYDEANLFGQYIYWFDYGAQINYSGSSAIFQQWFGVCTVRGHGKFTCTGNGSVTDVGGWFFCILDMECESCEAVSDCVKFWANNNVGDGLYKPHKVKAKRIYSQNRPCKTRKYSDSGKGACSHNKGLSGVMTAEQVANMQFKLLPFRGIYKEIIGQPEKNFTMMVNGEPGAGKTVFLMKFIKFFSDLGSVLYVTSEEFGSTTLTEKVNQYLNPIPSNVHFVSDIKTVNLSNYDLVVFDSINDLGFKLEDFKSFKKSNPETAFILVLQNTKSGQFKGGKEWEHEVQIAGEIENGVISIYKNRYGLKGEWNFFEDEDRMAAQTGLKKLERNGNEKIYQNT
jgi:hypothetical protein